MNIAQSADVLWYVLVSVLVISALVSRRFSLRSALGMALGWIAIFILVLILFTYRGEFGTVATKVRTELSGEADQQIDGDSLIIRMSEDGHFWANGEINGASARFLIDSGATITALSEDSASQAGLMIDNDGPGLAMQTANGTVRARRSSVTQLAVGPIRTSDLPVVVAANFGDTNVLGMNFLSRLKSWRVENGEMILEP